MRGEWTEYGRISEQFQCKKLEDVCLPKIGIQTGPFGSQLHKEDYVDIGTPIITVEHLQENRISHVDTPMVSDEDKVRLNKYSLLDGDIVFSRVGSVDRRSLVRKAEDGWLFSGRCLRVRVNKDIIDPTYLSYFFGHEGFKNYIRSIAVGATMPSINTKILSEVPIYFPSTDQQKNIAHILGTLDDKIELNRQMNETLEAMAQALFKSWFVDFDPVIDNALVAGNDIPEPLQKRAAARQALGDQSKSSPTDIQSLFPDRFVFNDEIGWIPEGWEILPILNVCDLIGGTQPPASTFVEEELEGYVRLLQIRDFTNDNHITYVPDSPKLRRVESDDILIGRYGSASGDRSKDSLGRICRGKFGVYNVALMKLSPQLAGREYCLQLYGSDSFYNYLYGISNKAVQSGFSKKELGNCLVTLPSRLLLNRYEEFGENIWQKQKQLNCDTENLIKLRDTLLPKLLSGELRIPDVEKQAAEVL